MRVLTIAGRWLAAVLGLSVLCIVLALRFFNPNDYRDEIQAWVSDQTGRRFTLEGELGWQIWPQLAVTLPRMRLGALSDTGNVLPPFAEWQQAGIGVRLWPLLQRRLEFDAVRLRGLRVRLHRDAAGRPDWQDLLQLLQQDRPPGRFRFSSLDGLQLDDAEISFDDALAQRLSMLRIASLHTDTVALGRPVNVTLKAQVSTRVTPHGNAATDSQFVDLPFTLTMQVQTDATLQHWQLENLRLAATMTALGVPADGMAIDALPITLRVRHADGQIPLQQLRLNVLQASMGDAQLIMEQGQLMQLKNTSQVAAVLGLEMPHLRQWLQRLDIEVPATRDAAVLQTLSAHVKVMGGFRDLRLQVLNLSLDQTRCSGEIRLLRMADTGRYSADLHADQLDLDRYMPVALPAGGQAPSSSPVPIDWLRRLQVQGRLSIDMARWQGMHAQQLEIALDDA